MTCELSLPTGSTSQTHRAIVDVIIEEFRALTTAAFDLQNCLRHQTVEKALCSSLIAEAGL